MPKTSAANAQAAFGDFQTPAALAREVVELACATAGPISTVVEPNCGKGSFLFGALDALGEGVSYYGFDINPEYVVETRNRLAALGRADSHVERQDFYDMDWRKFFRGLPDGVLVVGNPPWVTNSALGAMGSGNLPRKTNFQRHPGLAAKMGKANFDISEWMLIRLLEALQGARATLAMLCKTSTARKVLRHAWRHGEEVGPSSLHMVDAQSSFGVSVDACALLTHVGRGHCKPEALVHDDLTFRAPKQRFGILNGELVSDIDAYEELQDLEGIQYRRWRSGVKHDSARVMEFTREAGGYRNGLGEVVELEGTWVYPLLKSSDLARGRLQPKKLVLLTQARVGHDTSLIRESSPATWRYLLDHARYLDARRSTIYAKRPRFAIFGVGAYTFAPWKVAVSGLYPNLAFQTIGEVAGKPIIVDDTCYFIPCSTRREAELLSQLLDSDLAKRFFRALVFVDSKRPVTVEVLKRLDLRKLASRLGLEVEVSEYLSRAPFEEGAQQLLVFEDERGYGGDAASRQTRG